MTCGPCAGGRVAVLGRMPDGGAGGWLFRLPRHRRTAAGVRDLMAHHIAQLENEGITDLRRVPWACVTERAWRPAG